jgi:Family of unknown function (DUF5989)
VNQSETTPKFTDNERLFQGAKNPGFFAGFWYFLNTSKKWWLLLPVIILLLLGAFILLTETAAAPLIYTLF